MGDAAHFGGGERNHAVEREQSLVAALDPIGTPAAVVGREHDGADDGVETGGVAAAGRDGDSHQSVEEPGGPPEAGSVRISWSTSPGSACRRLAFFEKTVLPSTCTSNTPPDEGIKRTSTSG
jgi:hypothetical protein